MRFILGRAGSGKTHRCLEEIVKALRVGDDSTRLIYLVPEQATFLTERLLLAKVGAVTRAEVLSFRRLAWRILAQSGGALRPELNELGRDMALRAILAEKGPQLQLFSSYWNTAGFIRELATTMTELAHHQVLPASLRKEAKRRSVPSDGLGRKLSDLAVIHEAYLEYMEGRFTDPEGVLTLAAEHLERSSQYDGAQVWVDGFSGFNPQEYRVLAALLAKAKEITVALCLDPVSLPLHLDETELFHPTRVTHKELCALSQERHVARGDDLALTETPRFNAAPSLRLVEGRLYSGLSRAIQEVDHSVELVAAANQRAEVEAAGRKLISLSRDNGYRWRELAVILRQTEPYADLVAAVFERLGIPHFIDRNRPLTHHPLVELTRAVLELATGNWSYESVFRALKTDLFPLTRDEVDQLENYVLAHGIRGERWLAPAPWRHFSRFSLEVEEGPSAADQQLIDCINAIRRRVTAHLGPFYSQLRNEERSVKQVATHLFELWEEMEVFERLQEWSEAAASAGQLEQAQEHQGVYAAVVGLLDQLVEALGDKHLPLNELRRVIEAGLENLTLGMIPPALDQVMVGTIERSRHPELRAALVLGMSEGVFPLRQSEAALLGDEERDELADLGITLGPTARRQQLDELYLAYIACTRADHFLYLSYPLADEAGRALLPSPYIARLRRLFPTLLLQEAAAGIAVDWEQDLDYLTDRNVASGYLVGRLAQTRRGHNLGPIWKGTYNWLLAQPQGREQLKSLLSALNHSNEIAPLSSEIVRQLYGNPVLTSVSRMERFAACPLWHYLSYGLSLRKRPVQQVEAPEIGSFLHACLSRFVHHLQRADLRWSQLDQEQVSTIMHQVVEEVGPRLQGEDLLKGEQQRFLAQVMERALVQAVQVMTNQARRSTFETVASEVTFGLGGQVPPLLIELDEGWQLQLRGQIDRVDVAVAHDGGLCLRVIDYKSSDRDIDMVDLYHGLNLQLTAYLAVMEEHASQLLGEPVRPVGLFYQSLRQPLFTHDGPLSEQEAERRMRLSYRLKGLMLGEESVLTLSDEGLPAPGFESELVPVRIKRDGSPASHSRLVDENRLQLLMQFARHRLGSLGQRLIGGDIRAHPYRRQQRRACQWCEYAAACGFDVMLKGNSYRPLRKEDGESIWGRIAREVEGDGNGGDGVE